MVKNIDRRFFLFLLFILVFGGLMEFDARKKEKMHFDRLYSTAIQGVISGEIYEGGSGVHLTIEGHGDEFVFKYIPNPTGDVFSYMASPGDSIIKPAFADTITLIAREKVYKYTFQKF